MDEKLLSEIMHRWQFCATWDNDIPQLVEYVKLLRAQLAAAQARVKRLEEALGWYADENNYPGSADARQFQSYILSGVAKKARAALAEKP